MQVWADRSISIAQSSTCNSLPNFQGFNVPLYAIVSKAAFTNDNICSTDAKPVCIRW